MRGEEEGLWGFKNLNLGETSVTFKRAPVPYSRARVGMHRGYVLLAALALPSVRCERDSKVVYLNKGNFDHLTREGVWFLNL